MEIAEETRALEAKFRVVGVGASAGGIAALQALFEALPDHLGMAWVVIQHLPLDASSQLPSLLGKWSRLPVRAVSDDAFIEPGFIYVPNPGRYLRLEDGRFRTDPIAGPAFRPGIDTIDVFFDSLATGVGRRAIAVVLSGTGADGASGAARINHAGGLVLVQDPETAAYHEMPRAVIAFGAAHRVLSIPLLAKELAAVAAGPANRSPPHPGVAQSCQAVG